MYYARVVHLSKFSGAGSWEAQDADMNDRPPWGWDEAVDLRIIQSYTFLQKGWIWNSPNHGLYHIFISLNDDLEARAKPAKTPFSSYLFHHRLCPPSYILAQASYLRPLCIDLPDRVQGFAEELVFASSRRGTFISDRYFRSPASCDAYRQFGNRRWAIIRSVQRGWLIDACWEYCLQVTSKIRIKDQIPNFLNIL